MSVVGGCRQWREYEMVGAGDDGEYVVGVEASGREGKHEQGVAGCRHRLGQGQGLGMQV